MSNRVSVYYKLANRLWVKTFTDEAAAQRFIKAYVTGFYKIVREV